MLRIFRSLCTLYPAAVALLLFCLTSEAQIKAVNPELLQGLQASTGITRITLPEAQERAAQSPLARAAQLTIESARYHRQAVAADYLPKIGASFANMHFNKLMGQEIQLARRTVPVPLMNKDQTLVAVTAAQPVTPLFKIREAVNIAKADQRIAEAKAAKMVAEVSSNVEQLYFALLIAQRQHAEAESRVAVLQLQSNIASTGSSVMPIRAKESQTELLKASRSLEAAQSRVAELTPALNALIGFSLDMELELVVPAPIIVETITLKEMTQQALVASPEIVEAEQTVLKAGAGVKLNKLEYIPDVEVLGGYSYQTALSLLPSDFSFIGVMASFNVFDFGKREKTLKERQTNLELARLNLESVKAKVATAAQKTFLELERARRTRDLTRRLADVYQITPPKQAVIFGEEAASVEVEMVQAELDYRQAYMRLKRLLGEHPTK